MPNRPNGKNTHGSPPLASSRGALLWVSRSGFWNNYWITALSGLSSSRDGPSAHLRDCLCSSEVTLNEDWCAFLPMSLRLGAGMGAGGVRMPFRSLAIIPASDPWLGPVRAALPTWSPNLSPLPDFQTTTPGGRYPVHWFIRADAGSRGLQRSSGSDHRSSKTAL